jgi:hypothetical protein
MLLELRPPKNVDMDTDMGMDTNMNINMNKIINRFYHFNTGKNFFVIAARRCYVKFFKKSIRFC